jgi:hypothetical protein
MAILAACILFAAGRAVGAPDATIDVQRIAGSVAYGTNGTLAPLRAKASLAPDAFVAAGPTGRAFVRYPDGSRVDVGSGTIVQVGAYAARDSGRPNVLELQRGAIHFEVAHADRTPANYIIQTPAAQIAIRAARGFVISDDRETEIVSSVGALSVATLNRTYAVRSGETLDLFTSSGRPPRVMRATTQPSARIHRPEIDQFRTSAKPGAIR